jgi:serine/threonine protein kinase/Flp pilus assembly protein TadD
MKSERRRQIEQLYHSALSHEPTRRNGFLADACQGDADLLREVLSLLAQSVSGETLDDQSAWAMTAGASAATHPRLKSGETLGPYRLLGLLGTGGMGEVHLALDTRLDRKVAIKVCQERFSGRFEREARTISTLNHPNICTLYDVGANYLVMELVVGETLQGLLKTALSVESSLEIAKQVLEALVAAHRAGIVHRDLKPANIMVRADGYVKVLDFGLAKRTARSLDTSSAPTLDVSLPGEILGTVAYMSPEQIAGQNVDQRSDLFAFGIIFYEMLTGRHPWVRTSAVDTLHAILHDEAPLYLLRADVAAIVERLLRKSAEERYASAEAVLESLARSSDEPTPVRSGAQGLRSIAVLPFAFFSEVEEGKALSFGFADALITVLASLDDVVVAPTSSILKYAAGAEPAQVCRDLGVRHSLQGNVQKIGAQWRVSIQLFDVSKDRMTFSERFDFRMEDVFEVQDEIGHKVVEALKSRFPRTAPKARERYSSDPEAYSEFMTGLRESYLHSPEGFLSAAEHLSRAVERDPEFALAHAWLSYVSMQMNFSFEAKRSWFEKAEHHCQQALMLDPDLAEAHWARSAILWSPAKNFQHAEAIAALERVLEARPNFDRAHNRMAAICLHIGRFQEARIAHEHALKSNPKNVSYNLEFIDLYSGDFARAKESGEIRCEKSPADISALFLSAHASLMTADLDIAEHRVATALEKFPDEPLFISLQGMLHARRGDADAALGCVRKALDFPISLGHGHHTHHHVACIYAVLGENEKAMAWLEKSIDNGFPCWPFFPIDPYLENLRTESRFQNSISALEREFMGLKFNRL